MHFQGMMIPGYVDFFGSTFIVQSGSLSSVFESPSLIKALSPAFRVRREARKRLAKKTQRIGEKDCLEKQDWNLGTIIVYTWFNNTSTFPFVFQVNVCTPTWARSLGAGCPGWQRKNAAMVERVNNYLARLLRSLPSSWLYRNSWSPWTRHSSRKKRVVMFRALSFTMKLRRLLASYI